MSLRAVVATACIFQLMVTSGHSQPAWQEAPEKWSMPVKIRELSPGTHPYAMQPALTADGKTIYYVHYSDTAQGGIYAATFENGAWSLPIRLSGQVNRDLAEGPSISPDGKRLYFRMYGRADGYGGWDLYSSDWDSLMKDWGPARNLGPNINRADTDDWSCMTADDKHLYMIRYPSPPRVSICNDTTKSWGPTQWVDLYHFLSPYGRAVSTRNGRKIYYDPFVETKNTHDIYVNYYDTLAAQWSQPMVLNINKMMDTLVLSPFQRIQQDPWISPDGKKLYFSCTHDSTWDIWMSTLLIDENGNPVTEVSQSESSAPEEVKLSQNYPNPFNPSTVIKYEIATRGQVSIKVFDLLGREIVTLIDQQSERGKYQVQWDGRDRNSRPIASGAYLYRIQVNGKTIVGKTITVNEISRVYSKSHIANFCYCAPRLRSVD